MTTLEAYLRQEMAEEKIDFCLHAIEVDDQVEIYIHPDSRNGQTTPVLIVQANTVSEKVRPLDVLRGGE